MELRLSCTNPSDCGMDHFIQIGRYTKLYVSVEKSIIEMVILWTWNAWRSIKAIIHSIDFKQIINVKLPLQWHFTIAKVSNITNSLLFIKGSICNVCCGDLYKSPLWRLQSWWSLVTLGCTQAPKGIEPLVYNEGKHQLKILTLLIIDWFLPLKFHIPINFSLQNYFADCIIISNIFLDLVKGTMALNFMAGCSYWLWSFDP